MINRLFNKVLDMEQVQLSRYLMILVAALFIALIAEQFWSFYATFSFQPKTSISQPQLSKIVDQQYSATTIVKGNLFGQSKSKINAQKKIPTTNLQLILRGAFASSLPQQGSAMIEGSNGVTHSYRVNSKVNSSTTLHSVFNNRVILSHNGQLETLKFPTITDRQQQVTKSAASGNVQQKDNDIAEEVLNNFSTSEIRQTAKQLNTSSMTPEQRQELIKSRLQELRIRSKNKG